MRWLRVLLTVMLAAVWMPLTVHCQLESLTGLEVLRCAAVETDGAPADSHCDHGKCCGWESGQYHVPQAQPLPTISLLAVMAPSLVAVEDEFASQWSAGVLTAPPLGPPQPWQFALRAALPVRAPSFAS